VPVVLAGGGAIRSGRVVNYELGKMIPLANLAVSMLAVSGIPLERLGNSDGKLVEPLVL
jgi:hypothetical protein